MALDKEFLCIQRNDQNFDSNYDRDIYKISDRILPIATRLPTEPESPTINDDDGKDINEAKIAEYNEKRKEYFDNEEWILNSTIDGSVIHEKYFPRITSKRLKKGDKFTGTVHDIETYDDKIRILVTEDKVKDKVLIYLDKISDITDIRYINLNGFEVNSTKYPSNALIKNGIFRYEYTNTDTNVTSKVILNVSDTYSSCEIFNLGNNNKPGDVEYQEVSLLPVPGYNTISDSKVKLINLIPGREYSIDLKNSRIVGEIDGSPLLLNLNKAYTLNEKKDVWDGGITTVISILAVTSDTFVLCRNLSPNNAKIKT